MKDFKQQKIDLLFKIKEDINNAGYVPLQTFNNIIASLMFEVESVSELEKQLDYAIMKGWWSILIGYIVLVSGLGYLHVRGGVIYCGLYG